MSNVPKIIIKPRLIVPAPQHISAAPTPSSRAEDDDEDNVALEEDEREDGNMDLDGSQAAAGSVDDDAELGTSGLKGRGRPRGRTKGAVTPTSTKPKPKARTKGKTKPVVKTAGGLTIKLPKRGEEEGEAGEGGETEEVETKDTEIKDPEMKEGTPAVVEVDEGPIGGGKPFRRIQDKVYIIEGDEYVTEGDPKGDEKMDKWGNLLGGTELFFHAYW
jgi:chromatin structure-remodeling complex protein RSC7